MLGREPDGFPHLPLRPHNYMISHVPVLWVCRLRPVCHGWCFLTTPVLTALQVQALGCPQYSVGTHCPPSDHAEGKLSLVIREVSQTRRPAPGTGMGPSWLQELHFGVEAEGPKVKGGWTRGPEGHSSQAHRMAILQPPGCVQPPGSRASSVGRGQGTGGTRGGSGRGGREGGREWEVREGARSVAIVTGAGSALRPACPWGRR